MSYPKWVQRAPHIGAVLVQDEAEEKQLLDDWKSQQAAAVGDLVDDAAPARRGRPSKADNE